MFTGKKLFSALCFIALPLSFAYATPAAKNITCPCPGPCCPGKPNELSDMASYLSPWATEKNSQKQIENDLQQYHIIDKN